jgi:hypothetical protein
VVVLIYLGLAGMTALVWFRARVGLGPVVSAGAVLVGPLAFLAIATQLEPADLTGLANWVSGYSVAPMLLLPFVRPLEDLAVGVAGLVAVQFYILRDAGESIRDLHMTVLSGGAAPAIAIGAALLVSAMRRTVEAGDELNARAREAVRQRAVRESAVERLGLRIGETEKEAAELLEDISAGRVSCRDPDVIRQSYRLAAALRRELGRHGRRSLLQDLLVPHPGISAGDVAEVEVVDDDDLGRLLGLEDRIMLVEAVREAMAVSSGLVRVSVLSVSHRRAMVIVGVDGGPVPATETWRELRDRAGGHITSTTPGRWFYDRELPLRSRPLGAR